MRRQFPASLEVSSGVKTKEEACVEPDIGCDDRGVGTLRMENLGKRREFSYRVKVGVLLDSSEFLVPIVDCRVQQVDGSFRKLTPLRLVPSCKGLRCQGIGACGIVLQVGVLGLLLQGCFEPLDCPVRSVTQFRHHDDREVELPTISPCAYVELLPIFPCLVLVTQPGVSDGTVLVSLHLLRRLLDDDIKNVDGPLTLA
jgi:hypothetical protein